MDVKDAILNRRSYRSIEKMTITKEIIKDLSELAGLAPSCNNKQPWRFVFVYDEDMLQKMYGSLSKGNSWAKNGSLIIVVFAKKEDDCVAKEREYYLFDTGMAVANLMLRAQELGIATHAIAGYDTEIVKNVVGITDEYIVITLIIAGKKTTEINPELSENAKISELNRPNRLTLDKYVFLNSFNKEYTE